MFDTFAPIFLAAALNDDARLQVSLMPAMPFSVNLIVVMKVAIGFLRWLNVAARIHRPVLPSLRLTSRTISSIWYGCKEVGSFPSLERHSVKILGLRTSFGSLLDS